ncbi:MAG: hypothetical protein R3325_14445 [Thermoanaerobaculia bacterium]|nr:hypothetical protein [Thermoanaerobaculia bacterium]
MLQAIRRAIVILPSASIEAAATVATVASFLWLLANGHLQPILVYLLELYLSF